MNDEEIVYSALERHFEEDVEFLRKNIAPDDIYMFCQFLLLSGIHLLELLTKSNDLKTLGAADERTAMTIESLLQLRFCQHDKLPLGPVDLQFRKS